MKNTYSKRKIIIIISILVACIFMATVLTVYFRAKKTPVNLLEKIKNGNFESLDDSMQQKMNHLFFETNCELVWVERDINLDGNVDLVLQHNDDVMRIIGIFAVKDQGVIVPLWDENDSTEYYQLCDGGLIYYTQYYGTYSFEAYELRIFDWEWKEAFVRGLQIYDVYDLDELWVVDGKREFGAEGQYFYELEEQSDENNKISLTAEEWQRRYLEIFGKEYNGAISISFQTMDDLEVKYLDEESQYLWLLKGEEIGKNDDFLCLNTDNDVATNVFRIDEGVVSRTVYMQTMEIEENVYFDQDKSIQIEYPQIKGFGQVIDEEINNIIWSDLRKFIDAAQKEIGEELVIDFKYDVKCCNKNFISIFYYGMFGKDMPGRGLFSTAISTNIDIKNMKKITLKDIVGDYDELAKMLLNDSFDNISTWDGEKSTETISNEYRGNEELLSYFLENEEFDINNHYIEWYIESDIFVFVSLFSNYFEEYSSEINGMHHIFNEYFYKLYED